MERIRGSDEIRTKQHCNRWQSTVGLFLMACGSVLVQDGINAQIYSVP